MILRGRGLSKGIAESELILSKKSVSFLGGVDVKTGRIVDEESDIFGESIRGRVFAFPTGKGSTVGSYVLYGLALNDCAPLAILNERSEVVVVVGAMISDIPLVDQLDLSLLRSGDEVMVNANEGLVIVRGLKEVHVVTSFIENNGRILLLRRSEFVGTYQGLWAGVSGYLERDEEPRERAEKEIEEEVGMRKLKLLAVGQRVVSRNKNRFWIVHPFLFHASSGEVKLDWEHTEYKWVYPQEIGEFETVPRLSKTFQAVVHAMPHSRKKR